MFAQCFRHLRTKGCIVLDQVNVCNQGGTSCQLLNSVQQVWRDGSAVNAFPVCLSQCLLNGLLNMRPSCRVLFWNRDPCSNMGYE